MSAAVLATGTPGEDLVRYAGYALLAVVLPGTLVFRALRRRPHTLVEDLAVGAAVGLVLELVAWAAFTAIGAERWLRLWPLLVVVPFALLPRLRRHWWVRGYAPVPTGWAWTVTAVIVGCTAYLTESFLRRNPILPLDDTQAQYIDLAFQLSIAGAATHQAPLDVPQVAGEPLHYHWFGFAHLGAASLLSGVDLPTVFFRLAVPALCALAITLVAVAGWRISGRPYVGAGAAVLMFAIGEFGFENGIRQLFGTQVTFIVWGSPSMTYSWVLLIPLIAVLADVIAPARRDGVPALGRGAWALAVLLLAGSAGAKASSVPVVLGALGLTAVVQLAARRRPIRPVLAATAVALAVQVAATAVLFRFGSHGVAVRPLQGLAAYVPESPPGWPAAAIWAAVTVAFVLNLHLRLAGIAVLAWRRRGRLDPVQVFLLGGTVAGTAIYLLVGHPGDSNQYFIRASFAFGVILSAWGYAEALDRARLSHMGRIALGTGAAALAVAATVLQAVRWTPSPPPPAYQAVVPLLVWAGVLAVVALVGALIWSLLAARWSALLGRGGVVLLTGVLVIGAPGLVMDAAAARRHPNGGAYAVVPMPQSRVAAARWVYEHSRPDDVLATNVHCRVLIDGRCDARSFWLSGYAQRAVLVEGWTFAPRVVGRPGGATEPFWDSERLRRNDEAFRAPTGRGLADLRDRYGVRWLVVDRAEEPASPLLDVLAERRYDNGRVAVYEIPGA
ncbi:MAG TPA: hypothetical protein VHN18_05660 [Micromonosporaceae bacterium]|nr:hypothetical protein [Micromonosporaceae bacterium]